MCPSFNILPTANFNMSELLLSNSNELIVAKPICTVGNISVVNITRISQNLAT